MKVITIGKKLVPVEQVAFVEPFDPAANPEFKPEKDYKGADRHAQSGYRAHRAEVAGPRRTRAEQAVAHRT
ncbi:hypothetical protein [Bradyrhizobium iriomotense]|uniref:Uncharacterized protein n=1 Tax=Bradyrhizobium iriomotense TaxID=441950 RepID=A0ABQ6BD89_9BRAD|nr:hypothetical protein [Bradyrhizobium iriomotense]GLR90895.1 hypothetical protein GCM10007857_76110 [Bradyrhizobium iriomotense]